MHVHSRQPNSVRRIFESLEFRAHAEQTDTLHGFRTTVSIPWARTRPRLLIDIWQLALLGRLKKIERVRLDHLSWYVL